ncbi:MAG: thiamine ABC transporter substrate-binding protein [Chloroflexota bacterium]
MKSKQKYLIILLSIVLAACVRGNSLQQAPGSNQTQQVIEAQVPTELTVMTHDSFAISEEVLAIFEAENNAAVKFLLTGDTGTAVNKAILAGDSPLADVFYGVDNTFLSRALAEGIFEVYASPLLAKIPVEFQLDLENRALPVDFGDVCINYDLNYFSLIQLSPPSSFEDLLKPEYAGLLMVENPATSSPGLAFLFATIAHFGPEGYLGFWQGLKDNGLAVVNDWETAYYSGFTRWGGDYPMVVSYGSSPPFEVIFAEEPMDSPPTAALTAADTCFRQIEFVGILKGTQNRDLAEKWVDFMLSPVFQEDIPLQMFVFPVNQNAQLDPTFVSFLDVPDQPAGLDPVEIARNREAWIQAWTETILR